MAHLDTLNIVVKPNLRPVSTEDQKRHKLIIKLQEQLSMAEAELSGNSYRRMKWITQTNEQGQAERIQRPVRVKQWWFKDRAGNVVFALKYGAKPILISKDKSAVQVGSTAELPAVINTLIQAVNAGELDAQLSAIQSERQFIPKKISIKRKTA
jgi:hypothetical protein